VTLAGSGEEISLPEISNETVSSLLNYPFLA
jgi:hypothetical protein